MCLIEIYFPDMQNELYPSCLYHHLQSLEGRQCRKGKQRVTFVSLRARHQVAHLKCIKRMKMKNVYGLSALWQHGLPQDCCPALLLVCRQAGLQAELCLGKTDGACHYLGWLKHYHRRLRPLILMSSLQQPSPFIFVAIGTAQIAHFNFVILIIWGGCFVWCRKHLQRHWTDDAISAWTKNVNILFVCFNHESFWPHTGVWSKWCSSIWQHKFYKNSTSNSFCSLVVAWCIVTESNTLITPHTHYHTTTISVSLLARWR